MDKDLQSIQQTRDQIRASKAALAILSRYTQPEIDALLQRIVNATQTRSEALAALAVEETGFGNRADKMLKNTLAGPMVYAALRDVKTVGVVNRQPEKGYYEVAVPVGVIAALVPSTNPTSTVIYKSLIALKGANTVIFSPHPAARNCIRAAVDIIRDVLRSAGAPAEPVQCLAEPLTMQATDELMRHIDVGLILATGGPAMVKAAYSSGNPAIGVGAGNGPAFIERSADIATAVRHIIESKTFDNGVICASEQSIVTEACIEGQVLGELKAQGAYLLNGEESLRLGRFLLRDNNTMNPAIVGKTAPAVAALAGVSVPESTSVLISRQSEVSHKNGYAREKLCPILAFYVEQDWEAGCRRCIELLNNEGSGHTMTIHSQDDRIIREFALKKPVSRLLVNTPAALGGVGATTDLLPALTLGCGSVGKSSTSDNIGPLNLINLRRIAYGRRELSELSGQTPKAAPAAATPPAAAGGASWDEALSAGQIDAIVQAVLKRLS